MERIRVGDPMDKNTDMGAINSREQLERIEALVATGEEEGATKFASGPVRSARTSGFWFRADASSPA